MSGWLHAGFKDYRRQQANKKNHHPALHLQAKSAFLQTCCTEKQLLMQHPVLIKALPGCLDGAQSDVQPAADESFRRHLSCCWSVF